MERIVSAINNSMEVKKRIIENNALLETILKVAKEIIEAFKHDKKFCYAETVVVLQMPSI